MLPGYEYILAIIFFLCTAAAGVTTAQKSFSSGAVKAPSSFLR